MAHRAIRLHRVANKNETVASLLASLPASVAAAATVVIVTKVGGSDGSLDVRFICRSAA